MTARSPAYLKARYENGDVPQATNYEDVFDSYLNVAVSAEQSIDSNLRTTKQIIADSVSANSIYVAAVNISALSTTQASAIELTSSTNFIIFADGNNTAVKLPTSTAGRQQYIINAASTTLKVFPAVSGRFLVTAVNASLNLPADQTAIIFHKGDDRYGFMRGGI